MKDPNQGWTRVTIFLFLVKFSQELTTQKCVVYTCLLLSGEKRTGWEELQTLQSPDVWHRQLSAVLGL